MSSLQCLRDLITERLTAVAQEIFTHVERTVIEYEEEVDRQRKLLEIVCKPRIKLQRIELPQELVCKEEEVLTEQQLWNQERNSSLDQQEPESLQIKEDREICTSHVGEQLELKQEVDIIMVNLDNDYMKPELDSGQQLFSHGFPVDESLKQTGSKHVDSVSPAESPCRRRNLNKVENCRTLKTETENHTGKKSFKCTACGKCFPCKSKLVAHIRVHTGEKPYSCKTCGKRYRQRRDLIIHLRTHTGEKPYSCETCTKSFTRSSVLKVHERIHTGEKPYNCSTCVKSFHSMSSLKKHLCPFYK